MNPRQTLYDVLVILPVYNEASIIKSSVDLLVTHLEASLPNTSWAVLLAENGSTDKSWAVIQGLLTDRQSQCLLALHLDQPGRGRALQAAIDYAPAQTYLYLDADLPLELNDIERLVEPVLNGRADITVGRRAGKRPLSRRILTRGLQLCAALGLGLAVRDAQCGAKAFSRRAATHLADARQPGYFLDLEFLAAAAKDRLAITEVPISWIDQRFSDRSSKVQKLPDSLRALSAITTINRRLYPHYWAQLGACALAFGLTIWLLLTNQSAFRASTFVVASHVLKYSAALNYVSLALGLSFLVLALCLTKILPRLPRASAVTLCLGGFAAIAVISLGTYPTISQDIYHDLLLAKGQVVYGLNPYTTLPYQLHSDAWATYVLAWRNLPMTYGPAWTLLLMGLVWLGKSLFATLILTKILMLLGFGWLMIVLRQLLQHLAIPPQRRLAILALCALNPLVIQSFFIDVHNDLFIALTLTLSLYWLLKRRYIPSIFALIAGAYIKYTSIFLLPVPIIALILHDKRPLRQKLIALLAIAAGAAVLGVLLYLPFGLNPQVFTGIGLEATQRGWTYLSTYGTALLSSLGHFTIIQLRFIGVSFTLIAAIWLTLKRRYVAAYALPLLILFFFGTPWFLPWYALWILVPLATMLPFWSLTIGTILLYWIPLLLDATTASYYLALLAMVSYSWRQFRRTGPGQKLVCRYQTWRSLPREFLKP